MNGRVRLAKTMMMMRKKRWIWIGLLLGIFCLCGCRKEQESSLPEESQQESGGEESLPEESQNPEEPQEGGTLSMAVVNPDSFNPLLCMDEEGGQMLNLLFSPLLDVDEKGEVHPSVAESWQWEGRKLTLKINTDIQYHDGSAVTAADVVYSIGVIQQAEKSRYKGCTERIQEARAVSKDTVILTFEEPGEAQSGLLYFPVLSRSYYSKSNQAAEPMGTGPYMVVKHLDRRELQLKRNETYFGNRPYIEKIVVYLTRVQESVFSAFESGKTNLYYQEDTPWGLYENRSQLTLHPYYSGEALQLVFNLESPYFSQAENRKGAALVVNSGALLKEIHWNHGTVSESFFWPLTEEQIFLGYDQEKGKKQLSEQGTGAVLRLMVFREDELALTCGEMILAQLKEAGLTSELIEIDSNTEWQTEAWDVLLIRRDNGVFRLPQQLSTGGSENYGGYSEEAVNALLLPDRWGNKEDQEQLQAKLLEDLPVYTLFYPEKAVMTGRNVRGRLTPTAQNRYRGIENLYMRKTEN